jgi:hypothetical protein
MGMFLPSLLGIFRKSVDIQREGSRVGRQEEKYRFFLFFQRLFLRNTVENVLFNILWFEMFLVDFLLTASLDRECLKLLHDVAPSQGHKCRLPTWHKGFSVLHGLGCLLLVVIGNNGRDIVLKWGAVRQNSR